MSGVSGSLHGPGAFPLLGSGQWPDSACRGQRGIPAMSPMACLHFGEESEANMRWPPPLCPMVPFGIVIIKFRLFSFQNALEKSNHFANRNKHFQLML